MLLDLCYWQVSIVAGWDVKDLPVDVLSNYWLEMRDRELAKINYLNHSAALNVAAKNTKEGKTIEVGGWLPFKIDDSSDSVNIPIATMRLLKLLRDKRGLPMKMVQDLYKNKILVD